MPRLLLCLAPLCTCLVFRPICCSVLLSCATKTYRCIKMYIRPILTVIIIISIIKIGVLGLTLTVTFGLVSCSLYHSSGAWDLNRAGYM